MLFVNEVDINIKIEHFNNTGELDFDCKYLQKNDPNNFILSCDTSNDKKILSNENNKSTKITNSDSTNSTEPQNNSINSTVTNKMLEEIENDLEDEECNEINI